MTAQRANHALRQLQLRGLDAWAGRTSPGKQAAAGKGSYSVLIDRKAPVSTDDFAYLVKYAGQHRLELSFGAVKRSVLVLS